MTAHLVCRSNLHCDDRPIAVKREVFACPLIREFRNFSKFMKISGSEYSNGYHLLSTSLTKPNSNAKIKDSQN